MSVSVYGLAILSTSGGFILLMTGAELRPDAAYHDELAILRSHSLSPADVATVKHKPSFMYQQAYIIKQIICRPCWQRNPTNKGSKVWLQQLIFDLPSQVLQG